MSSGHDIDFNFSSPAPLIDWLREDVWYEVCPACQGACNLCLRCLDTGYVPHVCP